MKTQKQVALELIGQHITEYRKLDVHEQYDERLLKADTLLVEGKVHRQKDGSYLVQGSRPEPYVVNGQCQCQDYTRGNAPKGWCKHRLAAKVYQVVLNDLRAMQAEGVPHLHCVCEHKSTMALCWERQCPEPMDQLCELCLGNLDAVDQDGMSPLELAALAQSWEAEVEHAGPCLNGNGALPAGTLSPSELAVIAQPVYEENTSAEYVCAAPGKGKKPAPKVTMPEAPASLNLKLKIGNVELMYTARSMQPGVAGDQELDARLPGIFAMLERLAVEDHEVPVSWFRRLTGWCRITTNDRY